MSPALWVPPPVMIGNPWMINNATSFRPDNVWSNFGRYNRLVPGVAWGCSSSWMVSYWRSGW